MFKFTHTTTAATTTTTKNRLFIHGHFNAFLGDFGLNASKIGWTCYGIVKSSYCSVKMQQQQHCLLTSKHTSFFTSMIKVCMFFFLLYLLPRLLLIISFDFHFSFGYFLVNNKYQPKKALVFCFCWLFGLLLLYLNMIIMRNDCLNNNNSSKIQQHSEGCNCEKENR